MPFRGHTPRAFITSKIERFELPRFRTTAYGRFHLRRAVTGEQLLALAARILEERARYRRESIRSSGDAIGYLRCRLKAREHEVFVVLFLDTRHRVITIEEMFRGTIDGASVYAREVVREALARNAAAVILAHNHPSGMAEPSVADRALTARLKEALELVGYPCTRPRGDWRGRARQLRRAWVDLTWTISATCKALLGGDPTLQIQEISGVTIEEPEIRRLEARARPFRAGTFACASAFSMTSSGSVMAAQS